MRTVSFTEFRGHASGLLDLVEQGESLIIERHGRPIAEVRPVSEEPGASMPSWKRPPLRLITKGGGLSRAILAER